MNNSKKIISIIVALIILCVLFFAGKMMLDKKQGQDANPIYTPEMQTQDGAKKETSMNGSIFDLIKNGNTVKCTYSSNDTSMQVSGTSYVSGKKMRSDSEIMTSGTKMESHMISDGEWVYTWSSAMPQGIKMKLDAAATAQDQPTTGTDSQQQSLKGFQDKFDYKCTGWSVDNTMFNLPANVQFVDFSETMKNITNPSGGNNSMCAYCDYSQDAKTKADCRVQFSCDK